VAPISFFLVLLRASLLSVGGQTALPLIRDGLVPSGIVNDQQIIEALTIGRLSTGPGGLYVVSLGYFALGWLGAVLALVAVTLPPLIVIPASAFIRTRLDSPWMAGAIRGLALGGSGLVVATSIELLLATTHGAAPAWWQLGLVGIGLAAGIEGKRHPALVIALGAAIGIALGQRVS
jgi:chromate transporter